MSWLSGLGIEDVRLEVVRDGRGEQVYEMTSDRAPHRWPLQIGPAQNRGEIDWPEGVELHVIGGHGCRLWEGVTVLPRPFDRDQNEAWWQELGEPTRPM